MSGSSSDGRGARAMPDAARGEGTGSHATRGSCASRMTTTSLVARHLVTSPGAPIAVALLVLVLATVAVFAPLALSSLSDAAVRYRLDALSAAARDVESSVAASPQVGPGDAGLTALPPGAGSAWGSWDTDLEQIRRDAGPPASDALGRAQYFARFGTIDGPVASTFVAVDPRYEERIRLVEGRMPGPAPTAEDWVGAATAVDGGARDALPAVEIVLSGESAGAAGWAIGQTRIVGAEADWAYPLPLTLVGTFAPADPADAYWQRATGILSPVIAYDEYAQPFVKPTGFAAPDALAFLAAASHETNTVLTTVWYPFRVDAVTADDAPEVLAGLRGFTSKPRTVGSADQFGAQPLAFRTDAIAALATAIGEGRSLLSVLAMIAAGPVGVAVAVLVLGCRMMLERRRPALRLLSARGAASGQLRRLLAVEGLAVGVVPAVAGVVAGLLIAGAAFGGGIGVEVDVGGGMAGTGAMAGTGEMAGTGGMPVGLAALVAPLVLGLLPAAVLAASAVTRRRSPRVDAPERGGSPWRTVAELAVIGVAVLATALLIVRGVGRPDEPFDPLVAVAPQLLARVVCIATLRVYPALLRVLLRRERRGTGFVGFLGAARALRDRAAGLAPVLALIVGVAVAVSSGVLLSTVQSGAGSAARAIVGADLQLSASRFAEGAAAQVAGIPGVEAVAAVSRVAPVEVLIDSHRKLASLYLVDRAELDRVQAGHPPLVPPGVDLGDGSGTVPLLFSAPAAASLNPSGAPLEIARAPATEAGVVDQPAPFSSTPSWLLADAAYTDAVTATDPPATNLLVRLAPGTDAATVAVQAQTLLGPGVQWASPGAALAAIEGGPAAAGLRAALIGSIGLAAALSAIAVVMTLVLGTRARRRILALLQTLGAPPRSGAALVAWELWPVCAVALIAGAAFGAALPLLLLHVVDLQPFTGGAAQPGYAADPLVLVLAVGGFLVVTVVFTLIALAISRRARAAAILRTVEEL